MCSEEVDVCWFNIPNNLTPLLFCTKDLTLQSKTTRALSLGGHVGFDILPDQLVNKAVIAGFAFNILCIGKRLNLSYNPQTK